MDEPAYVCDRCGLPAVRRDGEWEHAEAADMVFCRVVMVTDDPVREQAKREVAQMWRAAFGHGP
jgi:hypothetical protein